MTTTRKRRDVEAALAALESVVAANDGDIDALPSAKPLGRRVPYVAAMLGGISERSVTNLLNAKKRAGVPKLYGWRVGKTWLVSDEALLKYREECEAVERGEAIE